MKIYRFATLFVILYFSLSTALFAQISLSTESMGLGGGGTAYLTGYEALFVNPANLYIQEKSYSLQISAMQSGIYSEYLLPETDFNRRTGQFRSAFLPYKTIDPSLELNEASRNSLLDRNYPGSRRVASFQSFADIQWLGIKWAGKEKSYALALRSRVYSRYELGRGLFSGDPVEKNGQLILDRSFRHQYRSLHELSFGYAESFDFLNGLSPRLTELIVGMAPKIVISGSYLNSEYENVYQYRDGDPAWTHKGQYRQQSSGTFTGNENYFDQSGELYYVDGSFPGLMNPSGIGIGIDVGVTYLVTFGNDLSLLQRDENSTEKSLRLSLSITDLGAIYQFEQPEKITTEKFSEETTQLPPVSNYRFTGAPNEHLFFLDHMEDSPFRLDPGFSNNSYSTMLPASIQAGALFQLNRIKLMGDVSLPVVDNEFATKAPVVYLGAEVKPLSFLPIRGGTRIAPHLPGYYSIGFGLQTRYFELNAALKVKSSRIGPTNEIVGASMAGIKIFLP